MWSTARWMCRAGADSLRRIASVNGKRLFSSSRALRNDEMVTTVETGEGPYVNKITSGGHTFIADEPVAAGGTNKGPTPMQYLMGALGSCTSITCRMYAARKGLPLEKVVVRVRQAIGIKENADGTPASAYHQFIREIEFIGKDLTDADREKLLVIANKCPVHHILDSNKAIVVTTLKKSN